ncbi:MAG: branched-chain amino acid ABC transporter permease [Croceibacterium sp.]
MKALLSKAGWALSAILLAAIPTVFGPYYTNVFVSFAIFSVFTVSLNLLLGYTGLFSFGHAMFFGAGGYGTALALKHISGLALLPAVGAGVLAAVVLALALCPIVVRVSGTAFAMLHLAFAQVMYVLALKLRGITGGEDGIGNFPIPPLNLPGGVSIPMKDSPENFYYFAITILALSLWLMWFFTKTPFGQIQLAIRENAKRVDYLGFKVPQTKAVIYLVSAAFAGVAGSLYGLFHDLVSADGALGAGVSFAPIINIMIGGIGSFMGPILGTAIFQVIEELASRYTDRVELVMGLIFVIVIMYAPMGMLGMAKMIKEKWSSDRAARNPLQKTA